MFNRLGILISRYRLCLPVLLGWALLVAWLQCSAPRWKDITHDGDFAYLPAEMTSVRGAKLLDEAFPEVEHKSGLVLVVARDDGELSSSDNDAVDALIDYFRALMEEDARIVDVLGPKTKGRHDDPRSEVLDEKLRSTDKRAALIVLFLRNEFMAVDNLSLVESIYDDVEEIRERGVLPDRSELPEGLQLGTTGSAAVGCDFLRSAADSIEVTERATIVLVVLILLLVYRAPGLVIVPLVTIGVSVATAKGLVGLLVQWSSGVEWFDLKVFSTTEIFIVVVLFGAGTDYCLFLISRYREELQRGRSPDDAIARALGQVGNALAASALTTIVGLAMMFFADFGKFSNSGPVIALCLAVTLAACVTLTPALLRFAGRIVFWPFGVGRIEGADAAGDAGVSASLFGGFWRWLARGVIARPGLILLGSVALLALPMWEGFSVPITYDLLGELDAERPSVEGTRLLRDHFHPGETGPVTILARLRDGTFDKQTGQNRVALLTKFLYYLRQEVPDAEEVLDGNEVPDDSETKSIRPILGVSSLTTPLGGRPGFGLASIDKPIVSRHPDSKAVFLSQTGPYAGKVTKFDLVFRYDPFSSESIELLDLVDDRLRALSDGSCSEWPEELTKENRNQLAKAWKGASFEFVGTTAGIRDLKTVTTSDRVRIQVLVVIAVLAVLLVLLRRPVVCVYLILSVLLGYFVTIGITEWFFAALYGDSFHGLDWKVPIFLFVLLIALGADYNIYLTTRAFEEQRRHGLQEGLRLAVICTGGIITSCGVIMAGTFASMTFGKLRAMHELGFALALGVLLDTFVIRTILVPAFLALLARRNERANEDGPRTGV
ncbi:MAG: MMPL family transporter [Candidatus Nealsonbacteria bacterium]|nr:MMPL family transporter [Candidatus Nealsonbacteria bacterium]